MPSLKRFFFQILVFLLPTQLAIHFWPEWALVFGIRVDYLAPTLHLTDILATLFLIASLALPKIKLRLVRKSIFLGGVLAAFVLINIFVATVSAAALLKWLKILELLALVFVVRNTKELRFREDFLRPLLFSSTLFSLIGLGQFVKGATIGGPLFFLGERTFNVQTPGISLLNLFGRDHLLPYSTFPHPNSLAGFLAVVFNLCFFQKPTLFSKAFNRLMFFILLTTIVLTFSLAAWLSLAAVFFVFWLSKNKKFSFSKTSRLILPLVIVLSLFTGFLNFKEKSLPESFAKRFELAGASLKMFHKNFLVGVGAGNFIVNLPRFSDKPEVAWFLQPVHNIYLLTLAETGIIGAGLFMLFLKKTLLFLGKKAKPAIFFAFIFILLVGSLDHYFLTLQQNLLLFSLVLGYSLRR